MTEAPDHSWIQQPYVQAALAAIEADPRQCVTRAEAVAYLQSLSVTDADIERIANYEQRTQEWHDSRGGRLTGSNYGSAAGHNPYSDGNDLAMQMLWRTFKGNAYTEYGTKYEPVACDLYEAHSRERIEQLLAASDNNARELAAQFRVEHPGLIVWKEHPWLGVSPDGIVFEPCDLPDSCGRTEGLLEIKCPVRFNPYFDLAYYDSRYNMDVQRCVEHGAITPYYYDQIQGIMAIRGYKWCDFAVFVPYKTTHPDNREKFNTEEIAVERFYFDEAYWNDTLFPALKHFYMHVYLPRHLMKANGSITHGQLDPETHIDCGDSGVDLSVLDDEQTVVASMLSAKRKRDEPKARTQKKLPQKHATNTCQHDGTPSGEITDAAMIGFLM